MRPPELVVHADWSKNPVKRWHVTAALERDGSYRIDEPVRVGTLSAFFQGLQRCAGSRGTVLAGFDFPIGLPEAYAREAGLTDFRSALAVFGKDHWHDFYTLATTKDEIAVTRPFYPHRPGGTAQQHLVERLGVPEIKALFRRCELGQGRRPACPLFWTLGAKQVGRAAISGWRDLIGPAASRDTGVQPKQGTTIGPCSIWPFDGSLDELLERPGIVVAETYPAEVYHHFALAIRKQGRKKTEREHRAADAPHLHRWVRDNPVRLTRPACAAIDSGFGNDSDGEDRFDAMVGQLGMLDVVLGNRTSGEPKDKRTSIEGWILGQQAVPTSHR